jgi:hypothetical protein
MIAVAGLRLAVIGRQWSRDRQDAGQDQGAVDLGGHASDSLQVHFPRVPKPKRTGHPTLGGHAGCPAADQESGLHGVAPL